MIYYYLICEMKKLSEDDEHSSTISLAHCWVPSDLPWRVFSTVVIGGVQGIWRLLLVNWQLKTEVEEVLYSRFTFELSHECKKSTSDLALRRKRAKNDDPWAFHGNLSSSYVTKQMQRLTFWLTFYDEDDFLPYMVSTSWKQGVQMFLGVAKNLRSLRLDFNFKHDRETGGPDTNMLDELVAGIFEAVKIWGTVPTIMVSLSLKKSLDKPWALSAIVREHYRSIEDRVQKVAPRNVTVIRTISCH